MKNQNTNIKKIEHGDAWHDTDEVVELSAKKPLDKVIPVRLPAEVWEKLRLEAKELGIGPTTLARMWIIERLKAQSILPRDLLTIIQLLKEQSTLRESLVSEKESPYEKE